MTANSYFIFILIKNLFVWIIHNLTLVTTVERDDNQRHWLFLPWLDMFITMRHDDVRVCHPPFS